MKHTLLMMVPWLRHRLRCPACDAIGTYKPHGGLLDRQDERRVKRWLCKWCGFYWSKSEGVQWCALGDEVWQFEAEVDTGHPNKVPMTPQRIVEFWAIDEGRDHAPWPWRS